MGAVFVSREHLAQRIVVFISWGTLTHYGSVFISRGASCQRISCVHFLEFSYPWRAVIHFLAAFTTLGQGSGLEGIGPVGL